MKTLLAITFAAGLGFFAVSPSQAAPVAPVQASDIVIQVAGGCGPGWRRGPYGGCRRYWGGGRVPYGACPRGYHRGPYGNCRRNYY